MWEKELQMIKQFVDSVPERREDAVMPTREQFTSLLSAPFFARRIPGIPIRLTEKEEYHCTPEETAQVREFLEKMYRITNKDQLVEYQRFQFMGSVHYEQFMTFWKGAPLFDVKELNPGGRAAFEDSKQKAEIFYPFLEERGFYAWDISEYLGVCRVAFTAGLVNEEEYREIVDRFVRKAQVFYHSFKEFALSYLCGGLYFMDSMGNDPSGTEQFLGLQVRVLTNLFERDLPWDHYSWYRPAEREWVQVYPGNPGSFLTKAAFEQGIGYMYRDEPAEGRPDSGWRFFHGDEPDDYVNDAENIQIVSLNTICNLRPDILAYLEAPVGSAYGWNGREWVKEQMQ